MIEGLHVFLSMYYRKPPKTRLFSITSTKLVPIAVSTEKRTEAACNFPGTCLQY